MTRLADFCFVFVDVVFILLGLIGCDLPCFDFFCFFVERKQQMGMLTPCLPAKGGDIACRGILMTPVRLEKPSVNINATFFFNRMCFIS